MAQKLTTKTIENLKSRATRYEIRDTTTGLALRVAPTGRKSWNYIYREGGRLKRITIGRWPAVNLADARKKSLGYAENRQAGKPVMAGETAKLLLKDLVIDWGKHREHDLKRPYKLWQIVNAYIIPDLGHYRLDALTVQDLHKPLDKLLSRGKNGTANRVLSVLKRFFAYAKSRGLMGENIASEINPRDVGGTQQARSRVLGWDEIKIFWHTSATTVMGHDMLRLMLLTGCRGGEVRHMCYEDINDNLWTIPAEHTKTGKVHEVHLTKLVLDIIQAQVRINDYVFPGLKNNAPLVSNYLAMRAKEIRDGAKMVPWTPHDLRRTFATLQAEMGTDVVVIEKLLNHSLGNSIMVTYQRHDFWSQRVEALEKWGKKLSHIVKGN